MVVSAMVPLPTLLWVIVVSFSKQLSESTVGFSEILKVSSANKPDLVVFGDLPTGGFAMYSG
ncbi:MAG: hypothetical protein ACSHX7_12385, partial [Luteolibacter sp.]